MLFQVDFTQRRPGSQIHFDSDTFAIRTSYPEVTETVILPERCGRFVRPTADFSLLRSWLESCDRMHRHQTAFRKTATSFRVIDVRDLNIVQGRRDCRFASLSYVWGATDEFRLSLANVEALERPASLAEIYNRLPRTFTHAIDVCRQLGIRYLWIDMLCI